MGFIFRLLLAVLAFQVIGGLVRTVRRRKQPRRPRRATGSGPDRGEEQVRSEPYESLTPYEIEDAEFEDLPKREE